MSNLYSEKPDGRIFASYPMPAKIDLLNERPRRESLVEQQLANQIGSADGLEKITVTENTTLAPRPNSRCTSADLLEKEAKLLREIEEIESKPYNPQTMVIEREQWYSYPEGRSGSRQTMDSKRRVRDFCSMPPGMSQDRHEHHSSNMDSSPTPGSIHTTIIRSPKREIDNKSPLPFAFDNFSTKGVRGNIASAGAVEPDRPRPPIYPIFKRTG